MIECKHYVTPSLVGLDTKQLKLGALQHVWSGASRYHKELFEEDACMEKKLKPTHRLTSLRVTNVIGTMDCLGKVKTTIFAG